MNDCKAAKDGGVSGTDLLNELSAATGLPDNLIGEELSRLIAGSGKTTDDVTLDDLRELLGAYLQEVLLEAKHSFAHDQAAQAELQDAAKSLNAEADNTEKNTANITVFGPIAPATPAQARSRTTDLDQA